MSRSQDDFVTFDIWIICKYKKGKRGQNGVEYYVYVTYKVRTSLNHIHQCYRQRFGIETSYRLKNLCRIRTTTKKPTLRILFVGISFLLVNIWVNLLWRKISKPRRGGRLIYQKIFPLKQMLSFLSQAVERLFQISKIVSRNEKHVSCFEKIYIGDIALVDEIIFPLILKSLALRIHQRREITEITTELKYGVL